MYYLFINEMVNSSERDQIVNSSKRIIKGITFKNYFYKLFSIVKQYLLTQYSGITFNNM